MGFGDNEVKEGGVEERILEMPTTAAAAVAAGVAAAAAATAAEASSIGRRPARRAS